MLPRFLNSLKFFRLLLDFDADMAEKAQRGGCQWCPGQLHQAHYQRKPRGGPDGLDEWFDRRFSYCCYLCRKRLTPPSFRFLGRRVYLGAILILISAMLGDASPRRRQRLQEQCGADARTLGRWRQWWAEAFSQTGVWRTFSPRLFLVWVPSLSIPRQLLRSQTRHPIRKSLGDAVLWVLDRLLPLTSLTSGGAPG